METYCAYILYSPSHEKIYIGSSGSLIQRFYAHNALEKKGWTMHFRPWVVVFVEFHQTKALAKKREDQLKQANWRLKIWEAIREDFLLKGYIDL